jgi:hypothetical protein
MCSTASQEGAQKVILIGILIGMPIGAFVLALCQVVCGRFGDPDDTASL